MVDIATLKPGDRVRIVSQWVPGCHRNPDGLMDHWLGQIVTVREVNRFFVEIEEDTSDRSSCGWCWYPEAIAEVVTEEDFHIVDFEESFAALLGYTKSR